MKRQNYNKYLIILTVINFSCESKVINLVGTWEGEYHNYNLEFNFYPDSACIIKIIDKSTGKIEKISGDFEIDVSKKPIPLTIRNIPEYSHPLYAVIKHTNDGSIKVSKFTKKWKLRPISINPKTSFTLTKLVKEL